MRAFFFWEDGRGIAIRGRSNPYAGLLGRALDKRGIHLDEGLYRFERDWLEKGRKDHEVLHLHWLHGFYRTEDLRTTVEKCNRFCDTLRYAKGTLGYRIVWTMHNFYPHERPFPEVDHLARLFVAREADAVIAHCRHAAGLCRKQFHFEGEVNVIPHGNFIDVFPNEVTRAEARERLGISRESFVYLFFGNARTYKGVDALIRAFREIDPDDAELLLMMRASFNPQYAQELRDLAAGDARVRVHTSDFFREELQVDIDHPRWEAQGGSKAKHLRYRLRQADRRTALDTLNALWEYREISGVTHDYPDLDDTVRDAFFRILERLGAQPQTQARPSTTPSQPSLDAGAASSLANRLL